MNGILSPEGPKTVFEISHLATLKNYVGCLRFHKDNLLKIVQGVSTCFSLFNLQGTHCLQALSLQAFRAFPAHPPPNGELAYTSKFQTACQHFFSLFSKKFFRPFPGRKKGNLQAAKRAIFPHILPRFGNSAAKSQKTVDICGGE